MISPALRGREGVQPFLYGLLNVLSASGIVFANKAVLSNFGFSFTYALTLIHTCTTVVGMLVFARLGLFEVKKMAKRDVAPLAAAYVAYIVFSNLNLKLNTTIIVLAGGCLFFGDQMPLKKLIGVSVALTGIIWYSQLKLGMARTPAKAATLPELLQAKDLLPELSADPKSPN
ncbi:hypothetical protein WJX72_005144 [[Myrmecia] bisecta]|uniref:Sugar phosphate transporter domain-containing protein n=1 Tax=[Myrmecia] bisecta TaxID=41462 RepID=A0AAW1QQI0_9CHLO